MSKWKDPIAEAERRGWNAAIEAAANKVSTLTGTASYVRIIRQLSKPEPEA